jgi:hypothetical protein
VEIVQSEEREDGGMEIEIVGRRKLTLISEPELLPGLGYTVGRVSFSEVAAGVPETDELSLSLQLEPHVEEWQRCVHVCRPPPPAETREMSRRDVLLRAWM